MSIRIDYPLTRKEGLEQVNEILGDQSFIGGHVAANTTDLDVLKALGKNDFSAYPNIKRWYKYIHSFTEQERKGFKSGFIYIEGFDPEAPEEEEEVDDLFGELTPEEEAANAQKKKDEEEKKKNAAKVKKVIIEKSSICLDIKPIDDETNMEELENQIRQIHLPSLRWNASKFIDVAYGIKKLQILCTIEDAKVSSQDLEDAVLALDKQVQSMDIVSWNKAG
jgi:translation elongation factor EF-1beta